MSLALDITVFDSAKIVIKGTYKLFSYDIQMDALSNATSSFTIDKNTNIMTGDYVAVRPNNSTHLMYYGQIITVDVDDSSNLMTLSANYIWNLLNGDIIVGSKSGDSYESHILKQQTTILTLMQVLTYSIRDLPTRLTQPFRLPHQTESVQVIL